VCGARHLCVGTSHVRNNSAWNERFFVLQVGMLWVGHPHSTTRHTQWMCVPSACVYEESCTSAFFVWQVGMPNVECHKQLCSVLFGFQTSACIMLLCRCQIINSYHSAVMLASPRQPINATSLTCLCCCHTVVKSVTYPRRLSWHAALKPTAHPAPEQHVPYAPNSLAVHSLRYSTPCSSTAAL
jgi:hypothetical protein